MKSNFVKSKLELNPLLSDSKDAINNLLCIGLPAAKDLYQVEETWGFIFLTHIQLCVP